MFRGLAFALKSVHTRPGLVIADLGSAALGLVWGWLLGANWTGAKRMLLFVAAALANAALAAMLGGVWAALALVVAALVGVWLHVTWLNELRTRRARADGGQ